MRILATTALALVAATATPALAQDGTFQGPRAEVIGGWDRVNGDGDGKSGFVYGGAIGYDLPFLHFLSFAYNGLLIETGARI